MTRKYVIGITVILAAAGALLPIGFVLHMSWSRAVAQEQHHLDNQAERVRAHAQGVLDNTAAALRGLNALALEPCSRQHVRHMQTLALRDRAIDEIAYVEGGLVRCTTWGVPDAQTSLAPPDLKLSSGASLKLDAVPVVSAALRMVAVRDGAYSALIEPGRFTDVVLPDGVQLALVLPGVGLLGSVANPDLVLVAQALGGGTLRLEEDYLTSVARSSDLAVVMLEPQSEALAALRREHWLWLPLGAVASAVLIALVVWLSCWRLSLRGELAIAIRRREFVLHYQPIMDLRAGTCVGAEALVRWARQGRALLRPDQFIPVAEAHGLITDITREVFRLAIRDMGDLLARDRNAHIAINLSAGDMKDLGSLHALHEMLRDTGIAPQQIWLEATEAGFLDVERARATIMEARELGHIIAIDDFGTGYSSLSYLQRLPLDALKIDKSFVDTIGTDSATHNVTDHVIEMAKSLRLKIVAEGIEHQEQADYLKARDVDLGQGWLFGKPMEAGDFIRFYRRHGAGAVRPARAQAA